MSKTKGPYEVTAKENGCIIFITARSKSKIVVTSKHSLPDPQDDPSAHGGVGYRWVIKHLNQVNMKEEDLADWIYDKKLTLVAEVKKKRLSIPFLFLLLCIISLFSRFVK